MGKLPLSGLRFRIAASLAAILVLFIVLTEVSISRLTRLAMTRHAEAAAAHTEAEPTAAAEKMEQDLRRLRKPVLFYLVIGAVLALLAASVTVDRLAVRPLHRLNDALERVADGKLDTTMPILGGQEIAEIGRAFNHMTAELKAQKIELENRLRLIEEGSRELTAAQDSVIRSAKLASVGTLAAGVAHEIGNPLTGLLGLTESLEAGVSEEDERKYLTLMKTELLRIDRIIRELLSYARAPSESESTCPLRAPLFEVMDNIRALLAAQSIFDRIEWQLPPRDADLAVALAPDDLTQLLLNLFLNAAEAMNGEGAIAVTLKKADAGKESRLEISVTDTGPGISPADAECIFDPFYTKRAGTPGTGLGLSVCQNLCERAGGSLRLDRNYTDGARFVLSLPRA